MNFASHTDVVVAAAAAISNVATPGHRRGRPYSVPAGTELAAALADAAPATDLDPHRVAALLELGRAVRPVFEAAERADLDDACGLVNDLLVRYEPAPYLDRHDGEPWHLHFHGRAARDRSGWGGGVAVGLATVLGTEYADRLGVCAAAVCDRVFVDVSRNGTRRFCSTACQNRVKAAAHRARGRA